MLRPPTGVGDRRSDSSDQSEEPWRRAARARRDARAASCGDRVAHSGPVLRHDRRLAAVGARLSRRLAGGVRGDRISTFDAGDDVWQGTFALPAGSFEYKAALNDSWDENYGRTRTANGANIPLDLASGASVKFYYDHESHWVTDNRSSVIAVAAGKLPVASSAARATGIRAASAPGCRTRTATGSTRSRRRRCRRARTRGRSRSTRAGTRTTAREGCRTGRTSRSTSRSRARR